MKFEDIKGLDEKQVRVKIRELRATLFETRMKNALGQVSNPLSIRQARKDVARLQTALRQRQSGKPSAKPAAAGVK